MFSAFCLPECFDFKPFNRTQNNRIDLIIGTIPLKPKNKEWGEKR